MQSADPACVDRTRSFFCHCEGVPLGGTTAAIHDYVLFTPACVRGLLRRYATRNDIIEGDIRKTVFVLTCG